MIVSRLRGSVTTCGVLALVLLAGGCSTREAEVADDAGIEAGLYEFTGTLRVQHVYHDRTDLQMQEVRGKATITPAGEVYVTSSHGHCSSGSEVDRARIEYGGRMTIGCPDFRLSMTGASGTLQLVVVERRTQRQDCREWNTNAQGRQTSCREWRYTTEERRVNRSVPLLVTRQG